jgi:hypothetical protein
MPESRGEKSKEGRRVSTMKDLNQLCYEAPFQFLLFFVFPVIVTSLIVAAMEK